MAGKTEVIIAGDELTGEKKTKEQNKLNQYVGHRIKSMRVMLRMTQADLAQELGITYQQVDNYERGKHAVSAGKLYAIAEAFGVSVNLFYEGLGEYLKGERKLRFLQKEALHASKTTKFLRYFNRMEPKFQLPIFQYVKESAPKPPG